MKKKVCLLILSAVLVGSGLIQPALGQEYPTKPIELVCPFPAGGTVDMLSRSFAESASKHLGQRMVVVNKPGAGQTIGAADVVGAKPDGYKIAMLPNTYFAITVKTQKIPFDPDDLVPLGSLCEWRNGMSVKSDSPHKTLGDLLDYAKKNPGKLRWAQAARGEVPQLCALLIFKKAGVVKTTEIPYKGSPEAVAAVLGGHVDAASLSVGSAMGQVKAGTMRLLVTYGDQRQKNFPDVPCSTELGFEDPAKLTTYFGLFIHKGTPEKIRETLINVMKKTWQDQALMETIEKLGNLPKFEGAEFMKESIGKAREAGIPLIKDLGLYIGS